MLARLQRARSDLNYKAEEFTLVGVGGVMSGQDALDYLKAGAEAVQSGTGAMWNPYLAQELKELLKQELALREAAHVF
jgi:dihydroorotate dehydrogenase